MAKKEKFYVIWRGRETGIFTDWDEAKRHVIGFATARYKSYATRTEAEEAFAAGAPAATSNDAKSQIEKEVPTPIFKSIAVDAACSGNPGKMEYRGVSLWNNKEIFHMKFDLGTNNIGEFLAIVHALGILKNNDAKDVVIYSDSKIAMNWVKQGVCKTKLQQTPRTIELLSLVQRAEKWLATNDFRVEIIKWPTEKWGEIPADFGRK